MEDALAVIAGVRTELASGDLRPLYLAWLAAIGTWERDEEAFDEDTEDEDEPPVPAGLAALTAAQRALADFLRLDGDLLAVAAQASPLLCSVRDDPGTLAAQITALPTTDKDKLLTRVIRGEAAQVQLELQRRFRDHATIPSLQQEPRTVAELLDTAAERRHDRQQRAEAAQAAAQQRREHERALARERHLHTLADAPEAAWNRIDSLIAARKPADYDTAVELLQDLRELAERGTYPGDFTSRLARLRAAHHRKATLIQRLDHAGFASQPT